MAKKLTPLEPKDKLLRQKCKRVSMKELQSAKFQDLIEQMLDIVYGRSNKGEKQDLNMPMTVGLSANQIGIMKQISIVDMAIGNNSVSDVHVLINPKIIAHSKEKLRNREGCVNLPEIWGMVSRYKSVIVTALDRSGNKITIEAKNWAAVLLQHEIDHLNGYLFVDRLNDPKHAHFVKSDKMNKYRDHEDQWKVFKDVSELLRKEYV